MAAFADILIRADAILEKYSHYDEVGQYNHRRGRSQKSEDPFSEKYFEIMDRIQELNLKASDAVNQKNRALLAVLKAEFRKEATTLEDEIRQLQQLVKHGGKKLSPEIEKERLERLAEAREAVEEFSKNSQSSENGFSPLRPIAKFKSKEFASGTRIDINGSGLASADSRAYMHTDQTKEFTREASLAKERQDIALENIERGLSTLKDLGGAMGEELQRHDGVIDEVGAKMEAVTTEIQNNNMKLKGIVTQVRSTRRFFIDIILICVLLAIGLYIFNMLD